MDYGPTKGDMMRKAVQNNTPKYSKQEIVKYLVKKNNAETRMQKVIETFVEDNYLTLFGFNGFIAEDGLECYKSKAKIQELFLEKWSDIWDELE